MAAAAPDVIMHKNKDYEKRFASTELQVRSI
jgi:hypothetical protein